METEEIMAENSPGSIKGVSLQIQEARVPGRVKKNKSTSIGILVQFRTLKTDKVSRVATEERQIPYGESNLTIRRQISQKQLQKQRAGGDTKLYTR